MKLWYNITGFYSEKELINMKKLSLKFILATLIIGIFITNPVFLYAMNTDANSFSKEEIKEDVTFSFNNLEKIHPNLYFASNKETVYLNYKPIKFLV